MTQLHEQEQDLPEGSVGSRLVNLMELLRIYANHFVQKTYHLGISIDKLTDAQKVQSIWDDVEHRIHLRTALEESSALCEAAELPITKLKVDHVSGCLKQFDDPAIPDGKEIARNLNNQLLAVYLHEIRDRLTDELSTKMFFQLPYSRKQLFEKPKEGWEQTVDRFPETVMDIEESAKCFALFRYAASVFHATQTIEHGLLSLGSFLSVKDPISGWTAVSNELRRITSQDKNKRTDFEKQHYSFIEQMQGTVEALKTAWRNKISHAQNKLVLMTADFSPDVAEEIRIASRSFMRRLATDLPK